MSKYEDYGFGYLTLERTQKYYYYYYYYYINLVFKQRKRQKAPL